MLICEIFIGYLIVRSVKEKRRALVKLMAEGHLLGEALDVLGVTKASYYRWRGADSQFKSVMDKLIKDNSKELVEKGFRGLASGYSTLEETSEWVEIRNFKGEPVPTKVKRKVTRHAPNINALKALANKYCAGEFDAKLIEEHNHNVSIGLSDRALTFEEQLSILNADKHGGKVVPVDKEDYKVVGNRVEFNDNNDLEIEGEEST